MTNPYPLDLKKIHSIYRNDHEAIFEMLEIFEECMQENLLLLSRAMNQGDTEEDMRFYVHKIRGSAAEIGATQLFAISQQMETHCIENELGKAAQLFPAVAGAASEVKRAIREYKKV